MNLDTHIMFPTTTNKQTMDRNNKSTTRDYETTSDKHGWTKIKTCPQLKGHNHLIFTIKSDSFCQLQFKIKYDE